MIFEHILRESGYHTIEVGSLVPVHFPQTRSGILQVNGNMAYCCTFAGLEGLFRKDQDATRVYGRGLCDYVKAAYHCDGFFTSDELPRYGITRAEIRSMYKAMRVEPREGVLIAIFAYDYFLSSRIRGFLIDHFAREVRGISNTATYPVRPAIFEVPNSAARLRLAGD
jgi:Glu-tRNA(Gln) amidotransferase subunit E-like FAD-binding protein